VAEILAAFGELMYYWIYCWLSVSSAGCTKSCL